CTRDRSGPIALWLPRDERIVQLGSSSVQQADRQRESYEFPRRHIHHRITLQRGPSFLHNLAGRCVPVLGAGVQYSPALGGLLVLLNQPEWVMVQLLDDYEKRQSAAQQARGEYGSG